MVADDVSRFGSRAPVELEGRIRADGRYFVKIGRHDRIKDGPAFGGRPRPGGLKHRAGIVAVKQVDARLTDADLLHAQAAGVGCHIARWNVGVVSAILMGWAWCLGATAPSITGELYQSLNKDASKTLLIVGSANLVMVLMAFLLPKGQDGNLRSTVNI
jgi:hypothetical protein